VRLLGYHPTRRSLMRSLTLALAGVPLVKLGRVISAEERRRPRHPGDLPPVPWIGHC
jgi:hypothetical protein